MCVTIERLTREKDYLYMEKEFFAFISYKSEDAEWATWLQHELEHYHLPASFNGRTDVPQELRPVFRDIDELSAGNLPEQIKQALANSQNLIVICSPQAAESPWVNHEVEAFISFRRTDRIFPFIVEGNSPSEFFPPALRDLPKDEERLGGNVNKEGRDRAFIKVVAGMLGIGFDTLWQRYEKEKAEEERKIREQRDKLLIVQSRYSSNRVLELARMGDNHHARRLCLEIVPTPSHPDYPYTPESESALREIVKNDEFTFQGHSKDIFTVEFSPDGKSVITASKDNTVRIWDVATGKCKMSITGENDFNTSASFSPDGKNIAIASRDKFIHIVDSATGKEVRRLDGQSFIVESVTYSPNGLRLASVSRDDILQVWDIEKKKSIFSQKGAYVYYSPKYNINRLTSNIFSPDGNNILILHEDFIQVWDIENKSSQKIIDYEGKITSAIYSPSGDFVMAVSDDNCIYLWDSSTLKLINKFYEEKGNIKTVYFTPDGSSIFVCAKSDIIRRIFSWDFKTGCRTEYGSLNFPLQSIYFSNGHIFAAGSLSKELYVKEISLSEHYKVLSDHIENVYSIKYNNLGDRLIVSSFEGLRILDCHTGDCVQYIERAGGSDVEIDASDLKLLSIRGESLGIWDVKSGQCLRTFTGHDYLLDHPVAMSKNGKRIATTWGNVIYIWNVYSLNKIKCAKTLVSEYGGADYVCFSPDGNKLAVASCTNFNIYIWSISDEELKHEMNGHTSHICSINYSPDGKKIVTSSYDGSIRIWNIATGVCEQVFEYSTDNAVFNYDGTKILFVSGGKASIWNVEAGIKIQDIDVNNVETATFSPNDKTVVLVMSDQSILLHSIIPFKELIEQTYERYKVFPLTPEERRKYYLD